MSCTRVAAACATKRLYYHWCCRVAYTYHIRAFTRPAFAALHVCPVEKNKPSLYTSSLKVCSSRATGYHTIGLDFSSPSMHAVYRRRRRRRRRTNRCSDAARGFSFGRGGCSASQREQASEKADTGVSERFSERKNWLQKLAVAKDGCFFCYNILRMYVSLVPSCCTTNSPPSPPPPSRTKS